MKRLLKYFLLFVVLLVFLHSFGILTNLNTIFSTSFTLKKFSTIKPGMRIYEVYEKIGNPLIPKKEGSICEYYSKEKNSSWTQILGWRRVGVCYDPVGKVSETQNQIFFQ